MKEKQMSSRKVQHNFKKASNNLKILPSILVIFLTFSLSSRIQVKFRKLIVTWIGNWCFKSIKNRKMSFDKCILFY